MHHFPTSKEHIDLDFIAPFQESFGDPNLGLDVMLVCFWSDPDFFDNDLMLLLLGLVVLFLLLIFEFAKVHDLANRRLCLRCDFNQIQVFVPCHGHGFINRENADLLARLIDHSCFTGSDLLIDPEVLLGGYKSLLKDSL